MLHRKQERCKSIITIVGLSLTRKPSLTQSSSVSTYTDKIFLILTLHTRSDIYLVYFPGYTIIKISIQISPIRVLTKCIRTDCQLPCITTYMPTLPLNNSYRCESRGVSDVSKNSSDTHKSALFNRAEICNMSSSSIIHLQYNSNAERYLEDTYYHSINKISVSKLNYYPQLLQHSLDMTRSFNIKHLLRTRIVYLPIGRNTSMHSLIQCNS